MFRIFYCFLFLMLATHCIAQDLYMPRNIKNAYQNNTRSLDGMPGKNYWQNSGDYNIDVSVDVNKKSIAGKETITYRNNSPDTLFSIFIRFVNNIHKPEAPRSGMVSEDFLTSGLHLTRFEIDNIAYKISSKDWGTVQEITLPNPIPPHSIFHLNMNWDYPLSKQSGREGQIDSTTFYCAYSYPRISVYDDYNGWDALPHTDGQEFYNDFNNYMLTVRAPKNYVVWATGDFLNPEETLQPAIAKRLQASYSADTTVHIATREEMESKSITLQNDWNIWKFKAENITDVCFALSNTYVWDAGSALVDSTTRRRASLQAAYNDTSKDFHHYVKWNAHSLKFFSFQYPGVSYPFSKMTAFQGFADMEYPMMINDESQEDLKIAQILADHEIAHTYFPFYMGINETRYAYMDEGWATTFEYLADIDENGKEYADSVYKELRVISWISNPATEMDQPVITMSSQLGIGGYGKNAYVKASLSYLALKDMLGDKLFLQALHHYMDAWHGKHPIPWDYFYAINTATKQNLNWFWKNWFFSNNYIDLKIDTVQIANNKLKVTVDNVGGFAVPFDIVVTLRDGKEKRYHYKPDVWKDNNKISPLIDKQDLNNIQSIEAKGNIFMDATPDDNDYRFP